MVKDNEQKYRKLTDIEHVLLRPGMYVGSNKPHENEEWLLNDQGQFIKKQVKYTPGFLKIFDEIISNSADEHRRNPKLNKITVRVDTETGKIAILDNGGIPVQKHKEYDEWIPQIIFSNLRAGSNFDDTEERDVAGLNGVGSTLTNIFSTKFVIETCDGKQTYTQLFEDHMHVINEPRIVKGGTPHTKVAYMPNLALFQMEKIDDDTYELMRKRAADVAACNPKLTVIFNGETFKFPNFKDYCLRYSDQVFFETSATAKWAIGFGVSNNGFQSVSFVNSVNTILGGTHVEYITNQLTNYLRERIKKKHKIEVKPSELKQHLFVFVNATIVNPLFDSQTKERLKTEARDFGSVHIVTEKLMKLVFESEIVKQILDWAEQKALAEERKQLRELNKGLDKNKVLKLVDAKARNDRHMCSLAIFEGDSAKSAFMQYRDPLYQGAFPLRGKFRNVTELTNAEVIKNEEVKGLLSAIGLKLGESPTNLRYGKIMIYTDQDHDGFSIAGLLMNFFGKYWPELFDEGRICKVETPLLVAKKGKDTLCFYSQEEYDYWKSVTKTHSTWNVEYKKGLAALENLEYKEIIQNPKYFVLTKDENFKEILDTWFGKDSQPRKQKILGLPDVV